MKESCMTIDREREPFRLFHPTYKGDGGTRTVGKWWLETRDHLGTIRRFAGSTDKAATKALARQIVRLVACRIAAEQPGPDLTRWLEQVPPKLAERFAEIGLLDKSRAAGMKPLREHLADFRQALLDKGDTPGQAGQVAIRVGKVLDGCGFAVWSQIRADRLVSYLAGRREEGLSAQTSNFYLQALKQFCRWMVLNRRASESPVAHLTGLNVKTDRRHDHVQLEVDEVRKLLAATAAGPEREGMTGTERRLLYKFAVESGLRRNELRTLTVSSFDWQACTVTVQAGYSKHRREDVLPLRKETAEELRAFLAGREPGDKVFGGRYKLLSKRTAEIVRADLEAAGIEYQDAPGRFRDFHALRHTTGSWLAACGVPLTTIREIMRHGSLAVTSRYAHSLRGQAAKAIEGLPDLSAPAPESETMQATGTDGRAVDMGGEKLGVNLGGIARQTVPSMPSVRFGAQNDPQTGTSSEVAENKAKTAYSAENQGLEATAPGRIRTSDLRFRKPMLYPAELRARRSEVLVL